jgi:hypothetical protein
MRMTEAERHTGTVVTFYSFAGITIIGVSFEISLGNFEVIFRDDLI